MCQSFKRNLILLLIVMLCFSSFTTKTFVSASKEQTANKSKWPECPEIAADSACVMELSSGLILYEKNMNKKQYPASITKIMTTMLALEQCSLRETTTISSNAIYSLEANSSRHGYLPDEKVCMEDLLYSVMLESANEGANAVAEHISGTTEDFAKLMTKRAKELGCKNTNFTNAHGLHNDNHYTTAYDMALISRAAMQFPAFREITSTTYYEFEATNKEDKTARSNHHKMLYSPAASTYSYEGCIGGKTGYTSIAQNTLVTFAKRGDMELVCVVLKTLSPKSSPNLNAYTDTKILLDHAFDNYTLYQVQTESEEEKTAADYIPITFNRFSNILAYKNAPIYIDNSSYIVLPSKVKLSSTKRTVDYFNNINLQKGDNIIGQISYKYGGKIVGFSNIVYTLTSSLSDNSKQVVTVTNTADDKELKQANATIKPDKADISSNNSNSEKKNLKPFIIAGIIIIIAVFILLYYLIVFLPRRRKRYAYYRHRKRRRRTFETFHHDYTDYK